MNSECIDEARVEPIVKATMLAIRDNYMRGPASHERVLEALNALAACAAIVILGAGEDPKAKEFFLKAFEQNICENREDAKKMPN